MQLDAVEKLGLSIKKVQSRHHRGLDLRLRKIGISLVQWSALREICRNPGASAHALAMATFNSDQAFGTLSARLEKLDYIRREPGHGRAIVHKLTTKGEKLLKNGRKIMIRFLEESFAPLSAKEKSVLQDILTAILEHNLQS